MAQATFGGNPPTERGTAGKIDVQEDGSWMCYAAGKTVLLRDVRKPTVCDTCALAHLWVAGGALAEDEN